MQPGFDLDTDIRPVLNVKEILLAKENTYYGMSFVMQFQISTDANPTAHFCLTISWAKSSMLAFARTQKTLVNTKKLPMSMLSAGCAARKDSVQES